MLQAETRYGTSAVTSRLALGEPLLGLQQPIHHQQLAHQVIESLAGGSPQSRSLSALVDTTRACALLTG